MSCPHGNPVSACDQCEAIDAAYERGFKAGQASQPAAPVAAVPWYEVDGHSDNSYVNEFAKLMKEKMAKGRIKGRGGWDDPEQCSVPYLQKLFHEHVQKGDPVDVANFCMMLYHYQAKTTPDFDVWQENPYTKVLMKSIKDDYIPKSPSAAPIEAATPSGSLPGHFPWSTVDDDVHMMMTAVHAAKAAPAVGQDAGATEWKCFQCGESFTDESAAALHFGTRQVQDPACTIDIAEYRAMEARMVAYNDEDAEIHRSMNAMDSRHQVALRRAEEDGYGKGVRDQIKEQATPAQAVPSESVDTPELRKLVDAYYCEALGSEKAETAFQAISAWHAAGIAEARQVPSYLVNSTRLAKEWQEGWDSRTDEVARLIAENLALLKIKQAAQGQDGAVAWRRATKRAWEYRDNAPTASTRGESWMPLFDNPLAMDVDLSGLTRFDTTGESLGDPVDLIESPTGYLVRLADVQAILAGQKEGQS